MHIWGKVLGFLFGLMISKNIFGALIGMWLGHKFDQGRGLNFNDLANDDNHSHQAVFFYTTFSVMGNIAKAKGRVSEHEIAFAEAYMDKLGLNTQLRQQAQDAFREGKMAGFPLEDRLLKFKRSSAGRTDLLLLFMEIQIQVAFANGELEAQERDKLHFLAKVLGFSPRDLERLLRMISASADFHRQTNGHAGQRTPSQLSLAQQLQSAYQVLGVTKDATDKEIKTAHRKLMIQHHPDKLVAKGLPPEMMDVAKQKTQDIQAAYDIIIKSRK